MKCPLYKRCPDFRGEIIHVCVLHWDQTKCPVYKRYPDFRGEIIHVCITLGSNEVSIIQEVS